ncbi:MAG: hypothetical protein HY335_08610 [Deinococcus sp.]|nr:hypothetical protein [Deinococcus sp.]
MRAAGWFLSAAGAFAIAIALAVGLESSAMRGVLITGILVLAGGVVLLVRKGRGN